MEKRSRGVRSLQLWISCLSLLVPGFPAHAADCPAGQEPVGRLVSIEGTVRVSDQAAVLNSPVCPGEVVQIDARARAALLLLDSDTVVRLDENTQFTVGSRAGESPLVKLINGIIHLFTKQPRQLKVETPYINAAVEGTEFLVRHSASDSSVLVLEGRVRVNNDADDQSLDAGKEAQATSRTSPISVRVVVNPLNAVQWALYYPPLDPKVEARSVLDAVDMLYRGLADEAETRLREIDRTDATALAYRAIIAVTQNRAQDAKKLADDAINRDPNSAVAYLARSYAEQAQFELNEARESVAKAIENDENNAVAWARLAELQQSLGDTKGAEKSAAQAAKIDPELSRTQSVLGFVNLTRGNIRTAQDSFTTAIELDETDPLPRLGLGLAKIRQGELKEGRQEIEIAASLDPNNSLIRSYLGKAYFEEKRNNDAEIQFSLAKTLDKEDPTPYFYDAVRSLAANRPVTAMENIQRSIEINDNRAVYRSQFQLDGDLAARSVGLGRVYNELGFDRLALLEGAKSLAAAPNNHSAHRFLADSYIFEPKHDIARVSELLQAQLRQPVGHSSLQLQFADTRLGLLNDRGPFEPSFAEFSRLFSQNGIQGTFNLSGGSQGLFGDELLISALGNNWSFSASQYHFETDGFRPNNDLKQDAVNLFAQYDFNPGFSVQLEHRSIDIERGDPTLAFDPEDFGPDRREEEDIDSNRFGFKIVINPQWELIGSLREETFDQDLRDRLEFGPFSFIESRQDGSQYELQTSYTQSRFDITAGIGKFSSTGTDKITSGPFTILNESKPEHLNVYVYSSVVVHEKVQAILGGSWNDFDGGIIETDELDPKLGIIYTPSHNQTFRAAYFSTLKRALISDQTIEPTSMVGFNQFYDEGEGTKADIYGVAWDGLFGRTHMLPGVRVGFQFLSRDQDIPGLIGNPVTNEFDLITGSAKDTYLTGYVYSTHVSENGNELAVGLEFRSEENDRDPDLTLSDQFIELETDRVEINLSYFNRYGFNAALRPQWINQEGVFVTRDLSSSFSGKDSFWIVDLELGWRFGNGRNFIAVSAKNLLDHSFNFKDTDPLNSRVSPERSIIAKTEINF